MTKPERAIAQQEAAVAYVLLEGVQQYMSDRTWRRVDQAMRHLKNLVRMLEPAKSRKAAALDLVHDTSKLRKEIAAYREYHTRNAARRLT